MVPAFLCVLALILVQWLLRHERHAVRWLRVSRERARRASRSSHFQKWPVARPDR